MSNTHYSVRRRATILIVRSFTRIRRGNSRSVIELQPGMTLEGEVAYYKDGAPGWFYPDDDRFSRNAFGPPSLIDSESNTRNIHWRPLTALELLALEAESRD